MKGLVRIILGLIRKSDGDETAEKFPVKDLVAEDSTNEILRVYFTDSHIPQLLTTYAITDQDNMVLRPLYLKGELDYLISTEDRVVGVKQKGIYVESSKHSSEEFSHGTKVYAAVVDDEKARKPEIIPAKYVPATITEFYPMSRAEFDDLIENYEASKKLVLKPGERISFTKMLYRHFHPETTSR